MSVHYKLCGHEQLLLVCVHQCRSLSITPFVASLFFSTAMRCAATCCQSAAVPEAAVEARLQGGGGWGARAEETIY